MARLDSEQLEEVRNVVTGHEANQRLTRGQKWDVSVLIASFTGGLAALLSVAGYFVLKSIAIEQAGDIAADDIADRLQARPEFIKQLTESVVEIPQGTVAAFDLPNGCPDGWDDFANARGRFIIGATPNGGQPGELTRREFRVFGGAELHTMTTDEMPEHGHDTGTLATTPAGEHSHGSPPEASTEGHGAIEQGGSTPGQTSVGMLSSGEHTHAITGRTGVTGAGKSFDLMPPFIALHLCKKA